PSEHPGEGSNDGACPIRVTHAQCRERPRQPVAAAPGLPDVARAGKADALLEQDAVLAGYRRDVEPRLEGPIRLVPHDRIGQEIEMESPRGEAIGQLVVLDALEWFVEAARADDLVASHQSVRGVENPTARPAA